MMMGDLLQQITDDATAAEIILGVGDLPMLNAMRERAEAEGLDLAAFSRGAVQHYVAHATDEEWVTVMGLVNRASDPAAACLKRAFSSALT
jgi:hypothetical protein